MTKETFKKATNILRQIEDLQTLRSEAFKPYISFLPVKKTLWLVKNEYNRKVALCDEGLKKVIVDYCDKRIEELEEELKTL